MRLALALAQEAYEAGEVPIGAVVTHGGQIIARGFNQTVTLRDPTAHAEMIALTSATHFVGGRVLEGCTLYVTVEPCPMCAGAIFWARVGRLVFGSREEKKGFSLYSPPILHPKTLISSGILADECREIMQKFFRERRL